MHHKKHHSANIIKSTPFSLIEKKEKKEKEKEVK